MSEAGPRGDEQDEVRTAGAPQPGGASTSEAASRRMGAAALLLSGAMLLSKLLGFVREQVIAYLHGASGATDAYLAAFSLPEYMNYLLVGGAFSITFVPLFSEFITSGQEARGWRMFSAVTATLGAVTLVLTAALWLGAHWLMPLANPGFGPETLEHATFMARIVLPAQLAFILGGLLNATLFVREVFWPAAVAPLVYNLCIIVGGLALEPWLGIAGFSVGALCGAWLGNFALPLFAARKQVQWHWDFKLRRDGVGRYLKLAWPVMVGGSLLSFDVWILRFFGTFHEAGAVTALEFGRKLMIMAFSIIGVAAGQAALPFLTRLFQEGRQRQMEQMLATSLERVLFWSLVASAGLVVVAEPLVFAAFQRGEFTVADAALTARLLVGFAVGMAAWSFQTMLLRGFYARSNTLTPMLVGSAVLVVALGGYWGLDRLMGVEGLAWASSAGMAATALATLLVYRRRHPELPLKPLGLGLGRGLGWALLCGGAAVLVAHFVEPLVLPAQGLVEGGLVAQLTALAMRFAAFGLASGVLLLFWRPPEVAYVLERVKGKLGRGAR